MPLRVAMHAKSTPERRVVNFVVRLSIEEHARLTEHARRLGVSRADWARLRINSAEVTELGQ